MSVNAAWALGSSAIATGTVRSVSGARIDVESASFGSVSARLATLAPYAPAIGDAVLIASADGAFFVIGVMRALRDASGELGARDGSSAALEEDENGSTWRLRDAQGRLIFEHSAARSVVHVHRDLELRAEGDLSLAASGAVRIESGESVRASAPGPIELVSSTGESSVRVDGDRATIAARAIETRAQTAKVELGEANVVVGTLRTVAHRIRERAELVERDAGRIVERAREVFREASELSQTKAGRIRLVAEQALSLFGKQTTVKAREDVKINGEKIYLG
jgi:hypothetical protein